MTSDLGPWAPLSIDQIVELLAGASFPWWITGGHALELHTGRSWRGHDDIDVGIRRIDATAAHAHLSSHHLWVAAAGVLSPWDGRPLTGDHENNVWARAEVDGAWLFDLTIGDGDDREWIYRRDPSVRRPWDQAVLRSPGGVPYLAPELQLLFKSPDVRPKDQADAEVVIPLLDPARRETLARLLAPDHPWQALLRT